MQITPFIEISFSPSLPHPLYLSLPHPLLSLPRPPSIYLSLSHSPIALSLYLAPLSHSLYLAPLSPSSIYPPLSLPPISIYRSLPLLYLSIPLSPRPSLSIAFSPTSSLSHSSIYRIFSHLLYLSAPSPLRPFLSHSPPPAHLSPLHLPLSPATSISLPTLFIFCLLFLIYFD